MTAYAGTVAKNAQALSGAARSATLTGLSGGTAYTFRVVAANAYGSGPAAASSAVTPTGVAATYPSAVLAQAPSAYYRLGETSGKLAADSSTASRPASYRQVAVVTGAIAGDPDRGHNADAGGQVAVGSPLLALGNAARSVEAWVKPGDAGVRYLAGWGAAGTEQHFSVWTDANTLGVTTSGDDRAFPLPDGIVDGVWHHVVVTYDGITLRAYLDGDALGTRSFSNPLDTLNPSGFVVGADAFGSSPFYGGLDEVAVYRSALSSAQVAAHFAASGHGRPGAVSNVVATPGPNRAAITWTAGTGADAATRYLVTAYAGSVPTLAQAVSGATTTVTLSGLSGATGYTFKVVPTNAYGDGPAATSAVATPTGAISTYPSKVLEQAPLAYYRLGELSGGTAADSSGHAGAATFSQALSGVAGAVLGDPNRAFNGDGGDCVASAPLASLPLGNASRSVEGWVKPSDESLRFIAGWGSSGVDRAFDVGVGGSNVVVSASGDDRSFVAPSSTFDGRWHHVVVTYNGSKLTAYLDGLALGAKTFGGTLNTVGATLCVGASHDHGAPIYGGLDEVSVYSTELSAAQVAAHFAASGHQRPSAVSNVVATAGTNRATISWSPASAGADGVFRYVVTAYAGSVARLAQAMSGSSTSVTLSGLPSGVAHTFKVVASNPYGSGPAATSAAVTPTGAPTTYAYSVLAQSPVAYYRLGETTGQIAADSSGNARLLTFGEVGLDAAGALVDDTNPAATANGACCIASGSVASLPLRATSRSLEAWIKPADDSVRYIASWGSVIPGRAFTVAVGGAAIAVNSSAEELTFNAPASTFDGDWHHLVVTYANRSVTVYLDGSSLGTQAFAAALDTVGSDLRLGSGLEYWQTPFFGDLDEVAIYKTALTAAQVAGHFSASGHLQRQGGAPPRVMRNFSFGRPAKP